jgi:prepilin-type N-terminal cleavage/methylation domain-containing protein
MKAGRFTAGFTLLEILMVVIVIGVLTTLMVGGFTNVVPAGREAAAVNKARIINAARVTYALTAPDSATQWAAAVTDAERATLLINAGGLTGTAADWIAAAGGYSFSYGGALRAKTVLRDKSGSSLNYSD